MNDINSFVKNDRKSQNMRGAVLIRRIAKQKRKKHAAEVKFQRPHAAGLPTKSA